MPWNNLAKFVTMPPLQLLQIQDAFSLSSINNSCGGFKSQRLFNCV